jgi:hypothetical protein
MKLIDVYALPIGTRVRTNLNIEQPRAHWFTGCITREPTIDNGRIKVIINKDDGSNANWIVYVTEDNERYFELFDREWDKEENI